MSDSQKKFFDQLPPLPVRELLPELLQQLEKRDSLALISPPGSGKTTLVPLALLTAPWLGERRILLQEPRRLAAKMVARRMASLLGEEPGKSVGWRMRGETVLSSKTRIEVVTDGVLLRLIQDDPSLESYGALIFDEFHERTLQSDLALLLARETQQALRPDLKLLALSATPDLEALRRTLGDFTELRTEGRVYPVAVHYRPGEGRRPLEEEMARAILHLVETRTESILAFLPGTPEIRRTGERLENRLPEGVDLTPLHGQLSLQDQERAIHPSGEGRRKVVLATSIAESSLTIEGIGVVIDSGLERTERFDEQRDIYRLETRRLSRDSADQRAGRAGRLGPGLCIRLWSEAEPLRPQREPEILRTDLSRALLELALWGATDIDSLPWPTSPDRGRWERARLSLQQMGAVTASGRLTPLGERIARLPVEPRLASFLLRATDLGAARLASRLAALLEEGAPERSGNSDLSSWLTSWTNTTSRGERGKKLAALAKQLEQLLPSNHHHSSLAIEELAALARPSGVAKKREEGEGRYLLASGRGAYLAQGDTLRGSRWIVVLDLGGSGSDSRITSAVALDPEMLFLLPEELQKIWWIKERKIYWDENRNAASGRERICWGETLFSEQPTGDLTPEEELEAWGTHLRRKGAIALPWTPAAQRLVSRVRKARMGAPEEWPDWSDESLVERLLGIWSGTPGNSESLIQTLNGELEWEKKKRLDEEWPERWNAPSGRSYTIDYAGETPTLSAPLQEFFGTAVHPLLGGKTALRIQLLSPAQRPIQTTEDLPSFWRGSYGEVRKEMRGRYPKHDWPEEPWSALPHRGPKRKRPT